MSYPIYSRYLDMWHYIDPAGKEYTQAEFGEYISKNFPDRYHQDFSVNTTIERKLVEKEGWQRVMQIYHKPELAQVVGKFLVVSQFTEPRGVNYNNLSQNDWERLKPDVYEERYIGWGRSTWVVAENGDIIFSGANYDSSG